MGKRYQRRAAELIRVHLSDLLRTQVNDARVRMVTLTGVEVNPTATRAHVYFSVLGEQGQREEALAGLRSAAGYLRRELGQRIRLRNTPELLFEWDASLERGERISDILDQLREDENEGLGTEL
jgi:ribosome-binding factor A